MSKVYDVESKNNQIEKIAREASRKQE